MPTRPRTRPHRPGHRLAHRLALTAAPAAVLMLGLPAAASAHVSVQPEVLEGGGFSVVSFRVPNERDDASTVRLRVLFPADHPLGSVQTTPVPGWRVTTATRELEDPVELFGSKLTEVISQVTWTATGRGIGPGQFQDFDLSLGALPDSGELIFRTIQTYSGGEQVNWNQVAVDESVEPERPAPVLTLAAPAEGDVAEDPPAATASPVALVLSGAALLVAVAAMALALTRRTR